jgi:hypothetical protein
VSQGQGFPEEEAMKQKLVSTVSLLSVSVLALALGGEARGTAASKSQIAIHEQGKNPQTNLQAKGAFPRGTFTIDLALSPFGPRGTTVITTSPGNPRQVNGQKVTQFTGTDTLKNTKGQLELAFRGIHIEVNNKLTPSGFQVGPSVEYGTWKIRTATGIYEGWKGGGNWAAALYGYSPSQPYSVEWDGHITH